MSKICTLFAAIATLWAVAPSRAAVEVEERDDGLTVFRMTVAPAAEPVPALAHRLTLRDLDVEPGNAAPFYYRAFMGVESTAKGLRDKHGDQYDAWIFETPADELPLDKLREAVAAFDQAVGNLREATVRQECDWGWHLEDIQGAELYSFLIPELQQSREASRALCLRARLAIAEGRFDDALAELRMNYKMARDMAAEPLLVNALVGVAEGAMGHRAVIEMIGTPGSPNMYWALSELPQPFVDMREAVRFEMSNALRVFPFMNGAEQQEHSPEEWARVLAEGVSQMEPLTGGGAAMNATMAQAAVTGVALVTYTGAKQRLVAAGLDPDLVERMPVGQVIAADAGHEYRRISDEFEKWWYVPFREARRRSDAAEAIFDGNKFEGGFGRVVAGILLPALSAARTAQVRIEWQTGALLTLEAIRMHAAETGELPDSLDEIEAVPLPTNPATGEPYQYTRDGDMAVLELPASDGFPSIAWRFEIKLAD